MHEAALACPSCGRPADGTAQGFAQPSGWCSFRGRIGRRVWWLHYTLPLAAAAIAGVILDAIIFGKGSGPFGWLISLASIAPSLAGGVKRLHDRGKSGWFMLVVLIPIIGSIWLFIETGLLRGSIGPNKFGADPVPRPGVIRHATA